MVSRRSVAVVGAGIAGAAAARGLHDAGFSVRVFDKGRNVGGRLATRRAADGLAFDHGAQYLTARDPAFSAVVERWREAGVAAPWGEPGWSVGRPGMAALPRALLEGVDVTTGCTVARIARHDDGWALRDGDGLPVAGGDRFGAVLLSCPALQAKTLLDGAGAAAAWPELDAVRYAPCWALMLAYAGPPVLEGPYRRSFDPEAAISWIARDGTKPGRATGGAETLVAHASPTWSRAHLELGAAEAERLLRGELDRALGRPAAPDTAAVRYAAAHRWRYSLVERAAGVPCLWSPRDGLGACGDGCLGGRVEAAYLSGSTLAGRVREDWA